MHSSSSTSITYLGHATFKIKSKSGLVIYIDPFAPGNYKDYADIILVSHEHFDHNEVDLIKRSAVCVELHADDFICWKSQGISGLNVGKLTYKRLYVNGIEIQAVPAYNKNHPQGEGVGFVIDIDGYRIYHAGDTSKTEEMSSFLPSLNLDYAFLPADGIFNMDIDEASECAREIGAKKCAVIHTVPITKKIKSKEKSKYVKFDEKKAKELAAVGHFVLKPGKTFDLK